MLSLQHDGAILGRMGRDGANSDAGEAIGDELTAAVSEAVGYRLQVQVAWCAHARAVLRAD